MMRRYSLLIIISFFSLSCATNQTKSQTDQHHAPEVAGEKAIEGTIETITMTADAARTVTEGTGAITEDVIIMSSDAVKNIIISLESLRKKGIETIGTRNVSYETRGPYIMYCPYCGASLTVTREGDSSLTSHTCPDCGNEFLLNWQDRK